MRASITACDNILPELTFILIYIIQSLLTGHCNKFLYFYTFIYSMRFNKESMKGPFMVAICGAKMALRNPVKAGLECLQFICVCVCL